MIEKIIEELEEQRQVLMTDAAYYNACGTALSSLEAHRELIGFEKAIDVVKKHVNDGWIAVEDRLPKKPEPNPLLENKPLELYMVTVKGTDYPFRAFWNGKTFTDGWSKLDVITWQPLPDKYIPKQDADS